jgi:arginyl-tRNA synthetase
VSSLIGLGALKYFILKVDPRKNMTFNPKESIDFNGNTGPFVQYTYARIQSVLRKAADKDDVAIKDLTSNLKFSKRHRAKRVTYYKEAGYPHRVTKVLYR